MSESESSILVLDTENNFNKSSMGRENIRFLHIEKSHKKGLETIKKRQPGLVIKVINREKEYVFHDILDFLQEIKQISSNSRILVINAENDKEKIYQLIAAGASGIHDGKSIPLPKAVELMHRYGIYISFSYQRVLVKGMQKGLAKQEKNAVCK